MKSPRGITASFVDLWPRHEVSEFQPRLRRFTPESRMVVYTPADDDTRERLPRTRT
jgi:hypothetical protein